MSESKVEEILCSLKLIAGLLALGLEVKWLAVVLFIFACSDFFSAVCYGLKETKEELAKRCDK